MDNERLVALIREHYPTPHRKVITCAPDVEQFLRDHSTPPALGEDITMASLLSIDIVVAGDSAPGTWQLIRHDHCKVITSYQGSPDYEGDCGAESGPPGPLNAICTLDLGHRLAHEAWGVARDHPAMMWAGPDGKFPPSRVSHQECTIIATEPSDPRATVART